MLGNPARQFSASALSLLFLLLVVVRLVYRYLRNPLRKIPAAHPLAPFTSLWINYIRWRVLENATLKQAHARLGAVVCLGPNEVSVNCVRGGIKDVYAGGFEKGATHGGYNWYRHFANFGVDNMFSTADNKAHSARKRMISNIYSKSTLNASPVLFAQFTTIIYQRFLPCLASSMNQEDAGVVDVFALFTASAIDIVTGYIFGLKSSSNLLSNPKELAWYLDLYNSRRPYNFWPQEHPGLTAALEKCMGYRLVPKWVDEANRQLTNWTRSRCERTRDELERGIVEIENTPVVYRQLTTALSTEAKKAGNHNVDVHLLAASEVMDHSVAGFETLSTTLTYVVHELCRHPQAQERLRLELQTLSPPITPSSSPSLPDPKTMDALPFLHAVIWETLRLHPAVPGPQPRITPPQGCRLGLEEKQYYVPGGVRVSASAGILHFNEDVYERATEWIPERWLDLDKVSEEKRKDMESRWFWAFGSGGRMCVGSHLALYQMQYIIAALYSNYSTTIVDDSGIEQADAYTAPPKGEKLVIRLHAIAA